VVAPRFRRRKHQTQMPQKPTGPRASDSFSGRLTPNPKS
jgi:hypothetical protein